MNRWVISHAWRRAQAGLIAITAVAFAAIGLAYAAESRAKLAASDAVDFAGQQDEALSRAAFLEAYPVFMHPRCMNCHPNGDQPLQGDRSHPHFQNVKRGPDGKGLYALKCANCHQDKNLPGEHMPPGNPNWHLTPPEMPMVFQGRSPAELAAQLQDPAKNGGKTLEEIIRHVSEDSLVLWGWDPGDGRTQPPLTHQDFARKMKEWADNGAAIPE